MVQSLYCGFLALFLLLVLLAPAATATSGRQLQTAPPEQQPQPPVNHFGGLRPITQQKLAIMNPAAALSQIVYQEDYPTLQEEFPGAVRYGEDQVDNPDLADLDAALVFYENSTNICYVAYQGTQANLNDWAQNLDFGYIPATSRMDETKTCEVAQGFYDAYNNTQTPLVEAAIDECMTSNDDALLVLTGHSQGGAVAVVSSLIHEAYQPLAIPIAQPPALRSANCEWINANNVWRIINSEEVCIYVYDVNETNRNVWFL